MEVDLFGSDAVSLLCVRTMETLDRIFSLHYKSWLWNRFFSIDAVAGVAM